MDKKIEDYTSEELYDMYMKKVREESEGSNLAVYSMFIDCGRMGSLEGTFLASEEEVMNAGGKRVYFGEVLGKHSEVWFDDFDELEVELVTDDPAAVKIFRQFGLTSGYNPFNYIEEDE